MDNSNIRTQIHDLLMNILSSIDILSNNYHKLSDAYYEENGPEILKNLRTAKTLLDRNSISRYFGR